MLPWGFATHVQRGFAQVKQCYEPGETCETPTELTFPEAVSQGTGKPADVRMMTGGGDDVLQTNGDATQRARRRTRGPAPVSLVRARHRVFAIEPGMGLQARLTAFDAREHGAGQFYGRTVTARECGRRLCQRPST